MQSITDKTAVKKADNGLLRLAENLLAGKGAYLSDSLYTFERAENNQFVLHKADEPCEVKARWLILGREHYFETAKEYPIASKRELQKVLRFEDNYAPFSGPGLQLITRINEQSHRVTFWVIKPHVLAELSIRPWLLVPESYLLAKALPEHIDLAEIVRGNSTLFLSKSGQMLSSGLLSSYVPDLQQFAFSTGASVNSDNCRLYPEQQNSFVNLLYRGLKALSLDQLQCFVIKNEQQNWANYPWKQASIIFMLVLTLYLSASSGWLMFKQQQLAQQLDSQSDEVNHALILQKKYQQQRQWNQQLNQPLLDQQTYWNIWPVLFDTLATDASVNSVQYNAGVVTLSGETDREAKATAVLAKLSENPQIIAPQFKSPITNYRGRERFTIRFTLAQPQEEQEGAEDASE